jgi:hypothetical protein
MRKATLSLLVLLIGFSIHGFGQTPQWKVVKEFHLVNSMQTVPKIGFLDAPANGVYRLSGYMAVLSNTAQNAAWFGEVVWTDRTGAESNAGMAPGLYYGSSSQTIPAQIICPQPGTQISLYILPSNPPPQDATYDIVLTLEKLTN